MQKAHDAAYNAYWKNKPNVSTPILAEQLNRNEQSVDTIDDRVISLDTTKANQADLLTCLDDVTWNEQTGSLTFIKKNGSSLVVNTDLEKAPINMDFDDDPQSPHYQCFVLTLVDGTVKYIDASAFVTINEFAATDTIQPSISNGIVRMNVKDGSITGAKLQPNYLADITTQANHASQSAQSASASATLSESWAIGGTDTREGENTNNSKYFSELAEEKVAELLTRFGIEVVGTRLVFGEAFENIYHIEVDGTTIIFSEVV